MQNYHICAGLLRECHGSRRRERSDHACIALARHVAYLSGHGAASLMTSMDYSAFATWHYLFMSFEGRIGRAAFWLSAIVLSIVSVGLQYLALMLDGEKLGSIAWLLFLYPTLAIATKRLNDRGRPLGTLLILFGPAFLLNLLIVFDIDVSDDDNTLITLLFFMEIASSLWMFVDLGCLRGTVGPNAHGPDPLRGKAS